MECVTGSRVGKERLSLPYQAAALSKTTFYMNSDQIKQSIQGKQAYTLNINSSMTERMVQNANECMDRLAAKRDELLPQFEEKRQAFETAQSEFQKARAAIDALDEEMRQQRLIVDALTNFHHKEEEGKRLRIHGNAEEAEAANRPKRERLISWTDEASAVLTESGKFMQAGDVFDAIVQKPHVREALKQMKTAKSMSTMKAVTVDNIISHALKVARGEWRGRFGPTFTVYKDLIGLVHWVDATNNPVEPYNQQFIPKKLQREQQPAQNA
jgi:hypothetical protein